MIWLVLRAEAVRVRAFRSQLGWPISLEGLPAQPWRGRQAAGHLFIVKDSHSPAGSPAQCLAFGPITHTGSVTMCPTMMGSLLWSCELGCRWVSVLAWGCCPWTVKAFHIPSGWGCCPATVSLCLLKEHKMASGLATKSVPGVQESIAQGVPPSAPPAL